MTAGKRDQLITFEARSTTQDPDYGTTIETWAAVSQAWAEVRDILPSRSESIDDSISIERRPARIRVDYFDGVNITSAMRIDIDGRKLRIIAGPAHKRDTSEWEMVAEELSSSGEEP